MMEQEWRTILDRFGKEVTVCVPGGEARTLRAFLQTIPEESRPQLVPTPLGGRREERLLYLGPPETPLTAGESRVVCRGQVYLVQAVRPVGAGEVHHWWAVLRPGEEAAEDDG